MTLSEFTDEPKRSEIIKALKESDIPKGDHTFTIKDGDDYYIVKMDNFKMLKIPSEWL